MTEREQTERALVGCALEEPDLAHDLKPEWFDDARLGSIIITITMLQSEGKAIDFTTVAHAVGGDVLALLRECQDQCHSPANFPYWFEIIVELAEKARLKRAVDKFLCALPTSNGDIQVHVSALENALSKQAGNKPKTLIPKEIALKLTDHLEQRMNLQGQLSGLATGFADLDKMIDGLQFGEMTVLASRPSVGKTAIACNITEKICLKDKVPTLFLSLEMSAASLSRRLLSGWSGIALKLLKTGKFCENDFSKFASFNTLLSTSPIFIREAFGGIGAGEAAAIIRRGAKRKQIKFVVLDYLQKLKPERKHDKRTYEVAETSETIVSAVKDTGVALLCLAQLNRESEREKGRRPRLSDLADSGQIERDADNVLLLHRDRSDMNKPVELIVAKQRDGETGIVKLNFDGEHCKFRNSTNQEE